MSDASRVALTTRVFTIAALTSIAAILSASELRGALWVIAIAAAAQVVSVLLPRHESLVPVAEGALIAVLAAAELPMNVAAVPYVAIPPLVAGLLDGRRGVLRTLAVEAVCLVVGLLAFGDGSRVAFGYAVTWLVTGAGLGYFALSFRRSLLLSATDSSYRSALLLIRQLHALSGRLTGGLDPIDLADSLLELAAQSLPGPAALYTKGPRGTVSALRYSDPGAGERLADATSIAQDAWGSSSPRLTDGYAALPLRSGGDDVAVLVVATPDEPGRRSLRELTEALAPLTLRLNAALLFGFVRDTATTAERGRLAREIHDGVAQDVASLGYAVDSLADTAHDSAQAEQIASLREEVTRVVGELRHSVFELRNDVGGSQGLGPGLTRFARLVGSQSGLTVHLTLGDPVGQLHPEVEGELLRIAQEAMTNARKHSKGGHLWVSCQVRAPFARVEVTDDGVGVGLRRRATSAGLHIMRERAERIGAQLALESPVQDGRGTRLSVQVGDPPG